MKIDVEKGIKRRFQRIEDKTMEGFNDKINEEEFKEGFFWTLIAILIISVIAEIFDFEL